MTNRRILLKSKDLSAGYGSRRGRHVTITGPLSLSIREGQLICLLGPNGAGKSTLLRTLAGLQPALGGSVDIVGSEDYGSGREDNRSGTGNSGYAGPSDAAAGKNYAPHLPPEQLAKKISLVLTDTVKHSNLTVYALVALGRYPYTGWLGILREEDRQIISRAMQVTGIEAYAGRKIGTLSDGESQKVMLARALAQDTPLLMLDEPTAHLDLPSRIQIMQLLHKMARETKKGILLSTHELDLALQVADEIWLLQPGGRLDKGVPEDLVLDGTFQSVFDKEGILFDMHTGAFHIHAGNAIPIGLTGDGVTAFWTKRALKRSGFEVAGLFPDRTITVREDPHPAWILHTSAGSQTFTQLSALLDALRI